VTPDNPNLLSYFKHKVRSEIATVSHLNLVEWGPAFLAIKSLKWCHLDALLIAVIIRKLSQLQTFVPLFRKGDDTSSQHVFKHLVHLFCLTIGLGMVS
jgi:hypothetical protein